MMNRFQSCVARAYADGSYAALANSENWRNDIDELGDGLFRYLILELATGENCEIWLEAIMRSEVALYELEQVSAALRAAHMTEKADGADDTGAPTPLPPAQRPGPRP
jgi:hypothetical protein